MCAGVHVLDDDRLGGHLDVLELGQVGVRAAAEGQDHLLAGVHVVAVDEHLQRGGRRGGRVAHGRDATGRSPAARGRRSFARLEQVEAPVLALGLLHRRAHPLREEHPEEHQRRPGRPEPHRMPPARCWSSSGVGQPGAHRPVVQVGYQSPPISSLLAHDRDAEEGVERQRQHDQQHPERVADPPGQRVDADDRPEEQAARPAPGGRASSRGRTSSAATRRTSRRSRAPTARPRRAGTSAAGRTAPSPPASAAPPAASAAGAAGSVRSASVTGAPSASASGTSIDSIMCWTMWTLSSVVSYAARPDAVAK